MGKTRLRYLVSDPSSYLYFDEHRPVSLPSCAKVNRYPYGLENRIDYQRQVSKDLILSQYLMRDIVYLLGTEDKDPNDPVMDKSCAALAQGSNRLERGLNYIHYLKGLGQTTHFALIQGADHDGENAGRKIFQSREGLEAILSVN